LNAAVIGDHLGAPAARFQAAADQRHQTADRLNEL